MRRDQSINMDVSDFCTHFRARAGAAVAARREGRRRDREEGGREGGRGVEKPAASENKRSDNARFLPEVAMDLCVSI